MAGGKGASSSCQDRARTREGKEGEKLSSITLKTLLSAEESGVYRLMCVCVCPHHCMLHAALAGLIAGVRLLGFSVAETGSGGVSGTIAPRGALHAGVRQPVCLSYWLQPLDE